MQTVYKLVLPTLDPFLYTSAYVRGVNAVEYRVDEWTAPDPANEAAGYWLMAFATLQQAQAYVAVCSMHSIRLFEAEAEEIKPCADLPLVEYGLLGSKLVADYCFTFYTNLITPPAGTILCRRLKLTKELTR